MPAIPNPTVTTGIRSTTVNIQQARRMIDMRDRIYDYDGDATPTLTIISKRLSSVVATSPKYQHLEDQPLPWWDTIATTFANATAQSFVATNGSFFRTGDVLLVRTTSLAQGYEMLKVTTVSGSTVNVIRNFDGDQVTGGTQAGTPNGTTIAIINNVNPENADPRTIKTTQETVKTNYTGIMRHPFGASNTLQGSALYGPDERTRQRKKQSKEHNLQVERAFFFSRPAEKTNEITGQPERTTGGIESYLSTNIFNANGPLTESFFETCCESVFRYGSNTKMLVTGRRGATQIDLIAAGRLQTQPEEKTYGVAVQRWVTTHGVLNVVISDTLQNDYAGYAFFIDMESVFKRFMRDQYGSREARLNTNVQGNGTDGWEDEYLSETGLHLTNEANFGMIKGIA